jgi:hypothetical protein
MLINCLWFIEAWETIKICEVIWILGIIFERQGPEKGCFFFG